MTPYKVDIGQTDVYDNGIWNCNLESLSENKDVEYEEDIEISSNIDLQFVEQPKLSLQEPVNLEVEEGETRTFQCQVCFI